MTKFTHFPQPILMYSIRYNIPAPAFLYSKALGKNIFVLRGHEQNNCRNYIAECSMILSV